MRISLNRIKELWDFLLFLIQECKVSTFSFLDVLSLPVSRQFEKVALSNEVSFVTTCIHFWQLKESEMVNLKRD